MTEIAGLVDKIGYAAEYRDRCPWVRHRCRPAGMPDALRSRQVSSKNGIVIINDAELTRPFL